MTVQSMLLGCLVMFGVTYATKGVTLLLAKRNITNRFVRSFLYYLPYSVLAVMVFPGMLFETASIWSGIAGTAVAVLLSFFRRGLLTVSLASMAAVFLTDMILLLV